MGPSWKGKATARLGEATALAVEQSCTVKYIYIYIYQKHKGNTEQYERSGAKELCKLLKVRMPPVS